MAELQPPARRPRFGPRLVIGAAVLAALAASALAIWGAQDDLDLDAVIPATSQVVSGTGDDPGAVAILAAIPVVAALPLLVGMRRWAILASMVVIGGFTVVTITRLGLLYLPAAALLLLAARRSSP